MTKAIRIIDGLGGDRHSGMCLCPAHDDTKPSLHVSECNGSALFKCFAGCSQEAVINVLKASGLWSKSKPSGSRVQQRYDEESEREQRAEREQVSKEVNERWRTAEPASRRRPYCERKGLRPDGLRMETWRDGANPLLVPMFDDKAKLRNVHFIHADGQKHSVKGGQHKDAHYWIKKPKRR
jgi:phage/plasmid primase-like uncharacterized protein